MISTLKALLIALALFLMSPLSMAAQSGTLDTSFGSGGISAVACRGLLRNSALQLDGKIVSLFDGYGAADGNNKLVRLNPDGSQDATFGTGGIAYFAWPAAGGGKGMPWSMTLQDDAGVQKIVVVGYTKISSKGKASDALRVDRFLPNGAPDTTFGSGGSVTYKTANAIAVAVQPGGKIVTAGELGQLVRLNQDGSLDTSFGSGGTANGNSLIYPNALAVQPDGKIVAAGYSNSKNRTLLTVARYNPNGSVDTSFGASGRATADFYGVWGKAFDVTVRPDGSIIAAGSAYAVSTNNNFAVARFTSNGQLDLGFGWGGKATFDSGLADSGYGVAVQSNGSVVLAGNTGSTAPVSDLLSVRFDSAGNTDYSFGTSGGVLTDVFGEHGPDYGRDVLIQNAGAFNERIVVTGASYRNQNADLYAVAAAYLP